VPLTITVGERPQALDRNNDTPPFSGGARYLTAVAGCTTGIPVTRGLTGSYMLSAGHCGDNGGAANIGGQPTPTGTILAKDACHDTLLINFTGRTQPSVYNGPFNSSTTAAVVGSTADFVGNLITTDGGYSGEHLNIPVTAVDVFSNVGGNPCSPVGPTTTATYGNGTCVATTGDSGGPVYSYNGPGTVLARGTISSGSGSATCPGIQGRAFSSMDYAPMLRPTGGPTTGSLQNYGLRTPAATVFDLYGTWTDGPGRGPGPVIVVLGTNLQVNMSAFHRPVANGSILNRSTISVTFPDDRTYTGQLVAPGTILWSNNSTWTKLF
jgi:hypothetical protein